MSLKLFRITEFAQSSFFFRPTAHKAVHPLLTVALVSLWIASIGNLPLWLALSRLPELDNQRGLWFSLAFAAMVFACTFSVLTLACWRWTLKPALTLGLLTTAVGGYFMLSYGIVIDPTMMVNVLQTHPQEVKDLITWQLVVAVLVVAVVPAIWLWKVRVRHLGVARSLLGNLGAASGGVTLTLLVALLVFQDFSSLMRNHTQLRYLINPLNSFYAATYLAFKPVERGATPPQPIAADVKLGASYARQGQPPLLILVLGETARSANFSINGYARATTPGLAGEAITSHRNAWSCGTSTAASVPCMFSPLGREAFEQRSFNQENLLDALQQAGLAVLWVDNQSGCKGTCDRIPSVITSSQRVSGLCQGGECYDEIMLQDLEQRIEALSAERRARGVVIVMHQMGSHGPAYSKRSPPGFKRFLPECTDKALQQCSQAQIINAYDNSIAYTDFFLTSVIKWLKERHKSHATAMMYVSDHGESLGENNLYLHGMPYAIAPDVQKRVPWINWLSPEIETRRSLSTECLKSRTDEAISHDHYFHSVLGLLDVHTTLYRPELDIFAPCRHP
ncbi:phosphoethanolamine transferase [Rhodoferax sp.]|uniref:phosphoethanolamine transferase n=1 Tax=Rhodoferax sp. TaxID=50421 RepID=UPI00274FE088|nr:phosphoethanolamine--lipid A transferase [Rhodoferax sp.]